VPLEYATALAMVAFATADPTDAPPMWMAAAAAVAVARTRSASRAEPPANLALHLLRVADRGDRCAGFRPEPLPQDAWIHAFTLGALGMTMLGLMTRVVLRHTNRLPPVAPTAARIYDACRGASAARILGAQAYGPSPSTLLWAAAFVIYFSMYGAMLARPSLPRTGAGPWRSR
jgi:uncharacterized protein involved in response to NO